MLISLLSDRSLDFFVWIRQMEIEEERVLRTLSVYFVGASYLVDWLNELRLSVLRNVVVAFLVMTAFPVALYDGMEWMIDNVRFPLSKC